jgi:hypothetical protein
MPFIAGQTSGLVAGVIMTLLFAGIYWIMKHKEKSRQRNGDQVFSREQYIANYSHEFSKELTQSSSKAERDQDKQDNQDNSMTCEKDEDKKNIINNKNDQN